MSASLNPIGETPFAIPQVALSLFLALHQYRRRRAVDYRQWQHLQAIGTNQMPSRHRQVLAGLIACASVACQTQSPEVASRSQVEPAPPPKAQAAVAPKPPETFIRLPNEDAHFTGLFNAARRCSLGRLVDVATPTETAEVIARSSFELCRPQWIIVADGFRALLTEHAKPHISQIDAIDMLRRRYVREVEPIIVQAKAETERDVRREAPPASTAPPPPPPPTPPSRRWEQPV